VLDFVVGSSSDLLPFFEGKPRSILLALSLGAVWIAAQFAVGTLEHRWSERQIRDVFTAVGPEDPAPAS
jgi:hypothetical protein